MSITLSIFSFFSFCLLIAFLLILVVLLPVAMLDKAPHATPRLSITYCDNIALTLHCLNLLQNSVEFGGENRLKNMRTHTIIS